MKNTLKLLCLSLTTLLIASCSNTSSKGEQSNESSKQADDSSGEVQADWPELIKEQMNKYLGVVLPFVQLDNDTLGAGYSDEYEAYGAGLFYIFDESETDLTTGYGDKLIQAGFSQEESDEAGIYYEISTDLGFVELFYGWAEVDGDIPAGNYINAYCPVYVEPYTEEDILAMGYKKQTGWPAQLVADTLEGSDMSVAGVNLEGEWFVDDDIYDYGDGSYYLMALLATKGNFEAEMRQNCIDGHFVYDDEWDCYYEPITETEIDVSFKGGYTFIEVFGPDITEGGGDVDVVTMDDDTLTQDSLGIKAGESAYDLYKAKGASGATYDVYCAATHGIQLRSKNSDSGIIAHLADGACKSITFVFDNNTYDGADRTVEIYGSNTAFGLTQMFNGTMTAIGTVSYDKNNLTKTYTFTTDYSYIGIRTRDGAIYFTSIQFVW